MTKTPSLQDYTEMYMSVHRVWRDHIDEADRITFGAACRILTSIVSDAPSDKLKAKAQQLLDDICKDNAPRKGRLTPAK